MSIPTRKTTPFHDRQVACGARMQSLKDWWLPACYTAIESEHRMVREVAGFVDYSFQSAIAVTGRGAEAFLQRTLVSDTAKLRPGGAVYTTILEPSGKVVDEIVVFRPDEDCFLINGSPAPRKGRLLDLLRQWSANDATTIEDRHSCMLAIQGPASRSILARALDVASMPFMSVRRDQLDGIPVLIARAGYSGELGFEIYAEPEHAGRLWDCLLALGHRDGLAPYGMAVTGLLSLEKGLLAPPDFYPGATPLELGLAWTVAFDKGDFNGRTELLRRQSAGLHTRLVGFEVQDHAVRAATGMRLFQGSRPVGSVTCGNLPCPSIGRNVGRCWVENGFSTPGTSLELELQGERHEVIVTGYRHYDPAGIRLRS